MEDNIKDALREMIEVAKDYEKKKDYEILKTLSSRTQEINYKIELLVIRWIKTNTITLECRKMFYKPKLDMWQMGRQAGIGLDELSAINKNYEHIKELLLKKSP